MADAAKLRKLFCVAAVVSLSLSGCGSENASASFDTIEPGKLVACTNEPYEPFEFQENGVHQGIDIDIVSAMATEWDLTPEFRASEFDTIFDDMMAGKCDLVASSVSITPERQEKYAFSDGYFEINQSLMVRNADASAFSGIESLGGRAVGVQKGTTGADYLNAHKGTMRVVEFDDAGDMPDALGKKEIDGVVQDFPINSYLAQKDSSLRVVQTFTDVKREQYGFAMPKESVSLRVASNKALKKIREDGRYDDILTKYLGKAVAE